MNKFEKAWNSNLGIASIRSLQVIIILAAISVLIIGMMSLSSVVIPIIIAVILASGFNPILKWMRSKSLDEDSEFMIDIAHRKQNIIQKAYVFAFSKRPNMGDTSSTVVTLISFAAIISFVVWGISSNVQGQWDKLYTSIMSGVEDITSWFNHLPFEVDTQRIEEAKNQIFSFLSSEKFSDFAISGLGSVVSFGTSFVLLLVILFFFMKDGSKIWNFLLLPFSPENRTRGRRLGKASVETFGNYIRGASIVAAVDSFFIWLALVILDVPLALSLAVITFILSFIPFVGATLGGAVAAIVALVSQGPLVALIVVIAIVLINQLEGNFLQPIVMGRSLSLHPLVVFLALIVGTSVAGIVGAILSVPLAAVGWKWLTVWNGEDKPVSWLEENATDEDVVKDED